MRVHYDIVNGETEGGFEFEPSHDTGSVTEEPNPEGSRERLWRRAALTRRSSERGGSL